MYQLTVTDQQKQHLVVLSLPDDVSSRPAADVVFDVLAADAAALVAQGILSEGQIEEFDIFKDAIFDSDKDGLFIRESVNFKANGQDLDPDGPFARAFKESQRDGIKYMRGELTVLGIGPLKAPAGQSAQAQAASTQSPGQAEPGSEIRDLSRVMFLHQIAIGYAIDVTKEFPELAECIAWAEANELIEIDVKKVAYKLTAKGKRIHDSYIEEAQDLIKRFDIYGNVDIDNSGIYFDTGLGRDLRVPAFEMEGVDPFRARFLLGINDGEWDNLSNWPEVFNQESWYRQVFAPVEQAPSLEEIGEGKMSEIMTRAKAILRQEQQNR
ncbi:MAG: hypothetical protein JSS83_03785 [Cyanobacteria bacterium SZAS LIN-3]|nr:hypothetical protein [Cyanobacteria bacterium SZAS LIN-3]